MTSDPHARTLHVAMARMTEGEARLAALGVVSMALHKTLFAPIIRQEQLRNVSAALANTLVSTYPTLLLDDPDPLLGALELAMIVGMLAGSRHAIPPEVAAVVAPEEVQA